MREGLAKIGQKFGKCRRTLDTSPFRNTVDVIRLQTFLAFEREFRHTLIDMLRAWHVFYLYVRHN